MRQDRSVAYRIRIRDDQGEGVEVDRPRSNAGHKENLLGFSWPSRYNDLQFVRHREDLGRQIESCHTDNSAAHSTTNDRPGLC